MINLVGGAPVQPLLDEIYGKAADNVVFWQCRQVVSLDTKLVVSVHPHAGDDVIDYHGIGDKQQHFVGIEHYLLGSTTCVLVSLEDGPLSGSE